MSMPRRLLIEQGGAGHRGPALPACDVPARPLAELLPGVPLRAELRLPQVSEPEVVRHFVELSTLNHHVDRGFYPLGSCTMKHNPRIDEALAALAADLRHQYLLGYAPAPADGAAGDGRWHSIEVRVPGRDVRIRARDGYYGRPAAHGMPRGTAP